MSDDRDLPVVSRSHGMFVRGVSDETRSVHVVASTAAIDSYDEIVAQNWDLKRYLSNPVVLYGHQSRDLPIGVAKNVGVVDGNLQATLQFVSEKANPKAEQVWQLFKEGALRAVSVGFNPKDVRLEKRDERQVYVLDNNELFEISVVPIPANPEALSKMRMNAAGRAREKSGAITLNGDLSGVGSIPTVIGAIDGQQGGTWTLGETVKFSPGTLTVTQDSVFFSPAASAASNKESTMTQEEQKALELKNVELTGKAADLAIELAKLDSEKEALTQKLVETDKVLEAEKAKVATLNERCQTLETERAAQQKRADELTQKAVEKSLDDLVGVKIAPAEKPGLVKLAALSPELFDEQLLAIKARPDMNLLGAKVVGQDPEPPASSAADPAASGEDLDRAVAKRLGAN